MLEEWHEFTRFGCKWKQAPRWLGVQAVCQLCGRPASVLLGIWQVCCACSTDHGGGAEELHGLGDSPAVLEAVYVMNVDWGG